MYERDWRQFLAQADGEPIGIAQLSDAMTAHLGATSNVVFLGLDYAKKAATKHRVPPDQFAVIFETVDYGIALADRPNQATFLYQDPFNGMRWFQVSVKCCFERRHLYVTTFHRLRDRDAKRLMKRHRVIRTAIKRRAA